MTPLHTKFLTPSEGKHSTSIQIFFSYRGVACRESFKLEATSNNIKWVERQRHLIMDEIERGQFDYRKRFPDPPKARLFCGPAPVEQNVTVGDKLDAYFELLKRNRKPSTCRGYRDFAVAYLYPSFGHLRLSELTTPMLREWIKGLHLKLKSIQNMLMPLRYILDEAVTDGIIAVSPLDKIKVARLVDRSAAASDISANPLCYEEIRAVLTACCDPQERHFWQFAIFSGLRTGELIGLRWQDVDELKGRVFVTNNVVDGIEDTVKTAAGQRWVDLNRPARWALEQQKLYTFMAGERVFYDPRYNAPWKDDMRLRSRWEWLCRKARILYRKPYVTRQTYCSQLLSQGKNPLYVAKQMGHKNMNMVIRHYGAWVENGIDAPTRPFDEWEEFCARNCTKTTREKALTV